MNEEQIEKLEKMYTIESDPTKLNYARFLEEVNTVFTRTGLEKDPIAKPITFEKKNAVDPRDILTLTEEEDLHNLLLRLGEVVAKHRILFKSHFQDKVTGTAECIDSILILCLTLFLSLQDIAKSGKVSFTRFRSILDLHKLPLTEEQFKLLCKR